MSKLKDNIEYLKEYFSLRPFEQYGLLIVLLMVIVFIAAKFFVRENQVDLSEDLLAFELAIQSSDSITTAYTQPQGPEGSSLATFDPNSITTDELLKMGIPPSAAKSIVNFRNSGFVYKKADDLLRCFGVDQDLLNELGPYIVIGSIVEQENISRPIIEPKIIQPFMFDPNKVTRQELESMNLPNRFIQGFLNFRNSGAKFYSTKDIEKIYSLKPGLKEKLLPYMVFPVRPNYSQTQPKRETALQAQVALRFRFDPNSISKDSLMLLGIDSRTANIWINYRNGGKVFYSSKDLQSIYGLDSLLLNDLSGWMDMPERQKNIIETREKYIQPALNIEPNAATQETLQKINGIGSYYANSIIWYRDELGGFIDLYQIGESKNLPDSIFQKIKYHFQVPDTSLIQKINVNKTSLYDFRSHPYMSYENAKRIISRRDVLGDVPNFNFLVRVGLLSTDESVKMRPYLSFN